MLTQTIKGRTSKLQKKDVIPHWKIKTVGFFSNNVKSVMGGEELP